MNLPPSVVNFVVSNPWLVIFSILFLFVEFVLLINWIIKKIFRRKKSNTPQETSFVKSEAKPLDEGSITSFPHQVPAETKPTYKKNEEGYLECKNQ